MATPLRMRSSDFFKRWEFYVAKMLNGNNDEPEGESNRIVSLVTKIDIGGKLVPILVEERTGLTGKLVPILVVSENRFHW